MSSDTCQKMSSQHRPRRLASKIDKLVLDFFVHEGYLEAAAKFAKEIDVDLNESNLSSKEDQCQLLNTTVSTASTDALEDYAQLGEKDYYSTLLAHFSNKNAQVSSQPSQSSSLLLSSSLPSIAWSLTRAPSLTAATTHPSTESAMNPTNDVQQQRLLFFHLKGYTTINERKRIKSLLLNGKVTEAIQEINTHFPLLLDRNNLLHFKLLRLNLIEMIRSHKSTLQMEADEKTFLNDVLVFVRKHLINKVANLYKLLKELEITMSLLCFRFDPTAKTLSDQKDLPQELKNFFDLNLRSQVFKLVNKAIVDYYEDGGLRTIKHQANNTVVDEVMQNLRQQGSVEERRDYQILSSISTSNSNINNRIYTGPRYDEFDLSNIRTYEETNPITEESENEEEAEVEAEEEEQQVVANEGERRAEDDQEREGAGRREFFTQRQIGENGNQTVDIKYDMGSSIANGLGNSSLFGKNNLVKDIDLKNEEEVENLIKLSLDSNLERVIKLYILTEQRKVDIKHSKHKDYSPFKDFFPQNS